MTLASVCAGLAPQVAAASLSWTAPAAGSALSTAQYMNGKEIAAVGDDDRRQQQRHAQYSPMVQPLDLSMQGPDHYDGPGDRTLG